MRIVNSYYIMYTLTLFVCLLIALIGIMAFPQNYPIDPGFNINWSGGRNQNHPYPIFQNGRFVGFSDPRLRGGGRF
ncbi:hypothetical protein FQR65_LT07647 [Abscondita terminalis]|nr:hypothetical protein FQR65_LT07647 [Abscondita terminalis]